MTIEIDLWRANIEADLRALSDREYQRASFTGELSSADTSPGEMISTIYDDDKLVDFVRFHLFDEAQTSGMELIEAIDALAESVDLSTRWEQIVRSQEWQMVVTASSKLLEIIMHQEQRGSH